MKKMRYFVFGFVPLVISIITILLAQPSEIVWGQTSQLPLISTRGHFDLETGELIRDHNSTDYNVTNIPVCPPEIAVFIHGWPLNELNASERFTRTQMSLLANNYSIPLIGFSWDANTTSSLSDFGFSGWLHAKSIANDNGPKLAQFILDFKNNCANEGSKVRLIAHSLGARVVLSALESLNNNKEWNTNNFNITSVHLMGAAVDNEEVSKLQQDILNDLTNWGSVNSAYGKAIEKVVTDFYNLYNPEDNVLEPRVVFQIYPSYELGDLALGQSGYQPIPYDISLSLPDNYNQINVMGEILASCDADGDRKPDLGLREDEIVGIGDNHGGYIGFRNADDKNILADDGAINILVDNWKNLTSDINQNLDLTTTCNLK
jgi:pimeloyl-ACP methyl ester carboxylesterase